MDYSAPCIVDTPDTRHATLGMDLSPQEPPPYAIFKNVDSYGYRDVQLTDGKVIRFHGACKWVFSDRPAFVEPFIKPPRYMKVVFPPSLVIDVTDSAAHFVIEFIAPAPSILDEEKTFFGGHKMGRGVGGRDGHVSWITSLSKVSTDDELAWQAKMTYFYKGFAIRVTGGWPDIAADAVPHAQLRTLLESSIKYT